MFKDGKSSPPGGCCTPMYGQHPPDYELSGWNKIEVKVYGDSLFQNLLNDHVVDYGIKPTCKNSAGQRVALNKGRVQLELEGSEFLFRNWEIRLFKLDSLYSKWYREGCTDPAYKEYSKTANLHIQSMCQVPVGILPRVKQKKISQKISSIPSGVDIRGHRYLDLNFKGRSK